MELTNSHCFYPICQGNSMVKFPRPMMETSRVKDVHTQKRDAFTDRLSETRLGVTPASGALSKRMAEFGLQCEAVSADNRTAFLTLLRASAE